MSAVSALQYEYFTAFSFVAMPGRKGSLPHAGLCVVNFDGRWRIKESSGFFIK